MGMGEREPPILEYLEQSLHCEKTFKLFIETTYVRLIRYFFIQASDIGQTAFFQDRFGLLYTH